jgi:AraC family L-rhamnose operon transcriptional activator RhaR
MKPIKPHGAKPTELAWLLDVMESRQPLSEHSPIWVRKAMEPAGMRAVPQRHPYCEISIIFNSPVIAMVEGEEAELQPGDLQLLGPGIPHTARNLIRDHHFINVYFLPSVLIEMGPTQDGVRALRRFTSKQPLASRLIRPPRRMLPDLTRLFQEMAAEFEGRRFGREMRLRSLFAELIVSILRWEESTGVSLRDEALEIDWQAITKALNYLRDHYAQPVYAQELAKAAGLGATRLKALFKAAVGMSWVKFLQGYRIHRAAALLSEPGHNVTEAALAAGFESLSHFNATFHSFMGVSPQHYLKKPEPRSND